MQERNVGNRLREKKWCVIMSPDIISVCLSMQGRAPVARFPHTKAENLTRGRMVIERIAETETSGKRIDDMVVETTSDRETFALGEKFGNAAEPGQIYTLVGDLGVGKTVFTQGMARGLGIAEPISSPTFTIIQEYQEGRLPFYHFDVYRIGDIEEMEEIGYDDYFFGQGVCMIEWANLIEELLPANVIQVKIEKDLERGFDYRRITVEGMDRIPV